MNFETKDVYELIDGVIIDGIEYNHRNDGTAVYECIHCGTEQNEWYNGKLLDIQEAKKVLNHHKNCPYTLAVSMNVGRDFNIFPLLEDN